MAKEIQFRASFSNGVVRQRGSRLRTYSHAWLAEGPRSPELAKRMGGDRWQIGGFSRSDQQCRINADSETRGLTRDFFEVVDVEVVT